MFVFINCLFVVVANQSYITFPIWGVMSLAKVENMATLQSFIAGGSGSMYAPPENLIIVGVLKHILVHSEAYREAHRAS